MKLKKVHVSCWLGYMHINREQIAEGKRLKVKGV